MLSRKLNQLRKRQVRKTIGIVGQKHFLARQVALHILGVALQRGAQGARNSDKKMVYGEAYQRIFPLVTEELR